MKNIIENSKNDDPRVLFNYTIDLILDIFIER